MNAPFTDPKPFLTGQQRVERFRHEVGLLTDREVIELLGWLLDTGVNDPCPDMSDDLIEALDPLCKAYRASYDAMQSALDPEIDRAAAEADYRYQQYRDDQMMRERGQ